MKTPEEILKENYRSEGDKLGVSNRDILIKSMKEYADQQNKELREAMEESNKLMKELDYEEGSLIEMTISINEAVLSDIQTNNY